MTTLLSQTTQEVPEYEILLLKGLLEECNLELDLLQRNNPEENQVQNDNEEIKEHNSDIASSPEVLYNERIPENVSDASSPAVHRSNQLQQKVELREKIGELENEIMRLVDEDCFDEADELEQERVHFQTLLNSL